MKKCPKCNQNFSDENRFCTNCGTPLEEDAGKDSKRFCTSCGALIEEGKDFCTSCGTKVEAESEKSQKSFLKMRSEESGETKSKNRFMIMALVLVVALVGGFAWLNMGKDTPKKNNEIEDTAPTTTSDKIEEVEKVIFEGETFMPGTYKLLYSVKVRSGAGVEYERVPKKDLADEYYPYSNDNGGLLPDTMIEVEEIVVHDNRVWGKISCGWVCLFEDMIFVEYQY